MTTQAIGFIGGGRVTRIFLGGWRQAGALPKNIVVSDPNAETLARLKAEFPIIKIAPGGNRQAAAQSVVFLAVHPPVMMAMLAELGGAKATRCGGGGFCISDRGWQFRQARPRRLT